MSEPLRDSDPKEIGGYELKGRLGAGGMGTVYLAHTDDGSRLAIKVLRSEFADSPEIRRRLAREADVLKRLAGGYTARVLDVNAEGEHPYLVMEYVPGLTLDKHVARFGPVTGGLAWAVVDALVEAAAQFHTEGVTHRDLKPSNVIIGSDGVKVIDFGVSRLAELVSLSEAGAVTGTLAWSSPEQALGRVTGEPSDVFNLGMLVAFAYTGRHPFGEGTPAAVMYRIVHESPNLDGLPSRLRVIVENCLAKSAAERPTASDVLTRVRAISRSSSNQGAISGSSSTRDAGQSTGTMIVDVQRRLDEDSARRKNDSKTSAPGVKVLAGVGAAIVAFITAVAVIGGGSGEENQASTTTAAESSAPAVTTPKSFEDLTVLPEDPTLGGYVPKTLQINLANDARHAKRAANRVFDLRWMAINCRRNNAEQPIAVQLDVAGSSDTRYERARDIAVQHLSDLLAREGRLLTLQAADVLSDGRLLPPIISSIPSDLEAEERNSELYAQFGSQVGIRPLRIILSPYSAQEIDQLYAEDLAASRAKQGWSLIGDAWPAGLRVDYGWSIAATRKLGWSGPKVIDAAVVTIAKEEWEETTEEQLLLLLSRALLIGLGASYDRASYSLLSIGGDGRFLKPTYAYSAADRESVRNLGLEDEPPCR